MPLLPRFCLTGLAMLTAAPALAHPGHLAGLAGHDHWVAGAAIGAAIALGLYGVLKGKKTREDSGAAQDDPNVTDGTEAGA